MYEDILGALDELVRLVPVLHELRALDVIQAHIEVLEVTGEEVVDLARDVQNVADTDGGRKMLFNEIFSMGYSGEGETEDLAIVYRPVGLELLEVRRVPLGAEVEEVEDERGRVHLAEDEHHLLVDERLVLAQLHLHLRLQPLAQLQAHNTTAITAT